jgi:hypothetical protein
MLGHLFPAFVRINPQIDQMRSGAIGSRFSAGKLPQVGGARGVS